MATIRKSPEAKAAKQERKAEQQAAQQERKAEQQAAKQAQKQSEAFDKAWNGFWASPAGQARRAFEAGDHVFQYAIDVMNQDAIIVAMIGSTTRKRQADPTAVVNAVMSRGLGARQR